MEPINFTLIDPEQGVIDVTVSRDEAYGVVHQIVELLHEGEESDDAS